MACFTITPPMCSVVPTPEEPTLSRPVRPRARSCSMLWMPLWRETSSTIGFVPISPMGTKSAGGS